MRAFARYVTRHFFVWPAQTVHLTSHSPNRLLLSSLLGTFLTPLEVHSANEYFFHPQTSELVFESILFAGEWESVFPEQSSVPQVRPIMSCFALSWPLCQALSHSILSDHFLSYILPCPVMSRFVLSCPVFVLLRQVMSYKSDQVLAFTATSCNTR